MITTLKASKLIAQSMPVLDSEAIALDDAIGRVLRQSVKAERDQPPFDRVTMDGIAIDFNAFEGGARRFTISGRQHAGEPAQALSGPANCIEIMTGAVLPGNCDCVIPVERISVEDGAALIEDGYTAERNQFVHPRGSDHRKDHEVLTTGASIEAMEVAVIASCGLQEVRVSLLPTIRVISTGNELIPPGQAIEPQQIRCQPTKGNGRMEA